MSHSDEKTTITLDRVRDKLFVAVIADALDEIGYRNQLIRTQLRPYTGINRLAGRAKTTLWVDMAHEDLKPYDLELRAVDSCQPDDVLIGAAGGSMRSGIWGELLSTAAHNQGCVGAILDGAVRDINQMTEMKFPVFARGTCAYDSKNRQRVVDIDVVLEIDGVRIAPGDLVFADLDGVVVIPQEVEKQTLQRAWDKVHAERISLQAIRSGMTASQTYEKYGVL